MLKYKICETCNGEGKVDTAREYHACYVDCETCKGTGGKDAKKYKVALEKARDALEKAEWKLRELEKK